MPIGLCDLEQGVSSVERNDSATLMTRSPTVINEGWKVMALVVSGQIRHGKRQPSDVENDLKDYFPSLVNITAYDFVVDRINCRIKFTYNNSSTLDFSVTVTSPEVTAPAAVALLIRETDSLNLVLAKALSSRFNRARMQYCFLEDDPSMAQLLSWTDDRPLKTSAASFSYVLTFLLAILCFFLIKGQLGQPPSDTRTYNIISLAVGIAIPAIAIPLPFLFEHLRRKESGRWYFESRT